MALHYPPAKADTVVAHYLPDQLLDSCHRGRRNGIHRDRGCLHLPHMPDDPGQPAASLPPAPVHYPSRQPRFTRHRPGCLLEPHELIAFLPSFLSRLPRAPITRCFLRAQLRSPA
ncbi:uncharacterized protein LOC143026994 isoform X1 [Oratosquilla oratoria]|uniref:uncharacterized protein LOC143026994 isoform X1 n=1 Tax=Oratosquilla oratoria TaxID=337810 RepID=UPI003F7668A3